MKYAIDNIEESRVMLENIDTKEKIELDISILPKNIHEGSILIYKDKKYFLNKTAEELRRKKIMEKFNKLKK